MKKGLGIASYLLPLSIALGACSDWDDHYDANSSMGNTSNKTLWENISEKSELSDFASILKAHGYDELLNGNETYTVWAPLNGTYDIDSIVNTGSSNQLTKFLQNHIAHNSYIASGSIDERIYVLNKKSQSFIGSGAYSFNGVNIGSANIANRNGVMHILNGYVPFKANIYESLNADTYEIDSISNFIHSYDIEELDNNKSTLGPVSNGEQTYLDSVITSSNILIPDANHPYRGYGAYINTEDSSYTMLLPTNKAWNATLAQINNVYKFIPKYKYNTTVTERNVPTTAAVQSIETTNEVSLDDVQAYSDSISRLYLMANLTFNDNLTYNRKLKTLATGQTLTADSLISCMGLKCYADDAAALFVGATRVDKSNGAVWITDSLRMQPWMVWNPKIDVETEYSSYQVGTFNATCSQENVSSADRNQDVPGTISNAYYCMVTPSSSATNPNVSFRLPYVRNTTYNIYAVIVPGNITNKNVTPLPNIFRASVGYNNEDGNLKEVRLIRSIESNPDKVDTLLLGKFTFPVSYYGIDDAYAYLRIQSIVSPSQASKYDRTIRIDKIMLVPTELDDYITTHPGYRYEE